MPQTSPEGIKRETGSVRFQTHVGLNASSDRTAIGERARVSQPVRYGEQRGGSRCKQSAAAAVFFIAFCIQSFIEHSMGCKSSYLHRRSGCLTPPPAIGQPAVGIRGQSGAPGDTEAHGIPGGAWPFRQHCRLTLAAHPGLLQDAFKLAGRVLRAFQQKTTNLRKTNMNHRLSAIFACAALLLTACSSNNAPGTTAGGGGG